MEGTGVSAQGDWRRRVGRWTLVGLLSLAAVGLLMEAGLGISSAPAPPAASAPAGGEPSVGGVGSAGGIIVVAGQVTAESYGLYLIDLKAGTISVYQYLAGARKLRLLAVRNFTFDVQLDEYNTEPPVGEIKKLVQQHRRLSQTK